MHRYFSQYPVFKQSGEKFAPYGRARMSAAKGEVQQIENCLGGFHFILVDIFQLVVHLWHFLTPDKQEFQSLYFSRLLGNLPNGGRDENATKQNALHVNFKFW